MEIEEGVGRNFYEPMMIEVTRQRFEVVVVMEGTSETSNMTFQVFKSPHLKHHNCHHLKQHLKSLIIIRQEPPIFLMKSNGGRDLSRC